MRRMVLLGIGALASCTTSYIEFKGECVIQEWTLVSTVLRRRQLCDLPPPSGDDPEVRDREAMEVNPFPDLTDRLNKADSMDPNLLEKNMGFDPDAPIETTDD